MHSARVVDTVCDETMLIQLYSSYVNIVYECLVYATSARGEDSAIGDMC